METIQMSIDNEWKKKNGIYIKWSIMKYFFLKKNIVSRATTQVNH